MGIYAPNNPVRTSVIAWKWGAYLGEEALKSGIRGTSSSFARHHINVSLAKAKMMGQYTNSVLAKREAKFGGYDEAILLDTHGYVSEGSGENIFIVKNGKLITPDLSSSILEGITRDTVITLARERGLTVPRPASPATSSGSRMRCSSPAPRPRSRRCARSTTAPIGEGVVGPSRRVQARFFDSCGAATTSRRVALRPLTPPALPVALAALGLLAGCGDPPVTKAAPRAPGPDAPASAAGHPPEYATDDAAWGKFHSKRFQVTVPLPDGRAWKIDDHRNAELVAAHAPTDSHLTHPRHPGGGADEPSAVRGARPCPRLGEEVDAHDRRQSGHRPPGRLRLARLGRARCDQGGRRGRDVYLFGAFLRRCLLVHLTTSVSSPKDEEVLAARLAVGSARIVKAITIDPPRTTDGAVVPRDKPDIRR